MSERENSVARQEFLDKGGIFLGQKEWDRLIFGIEELLRAYWKKNPMAVDDWQRRHEGMLLQEVYVAGACKTAKRKNEKGKTEFYYIDTYVRKDEDGNYVTLAEINGDMAEKPAERSDIVGYLCWKLLDRNSRGVTLKTICEELFDGDE